WSCPPPTRRRRVVPSSIRSGRRATERWSRPGRLSRMSETLAPDWATRGLSGDQVAERLADGRVNTLPTAPTRTVGEIVRANVLTPVNAIVGVLLVFVVLANGISPDMLFGGVIITNSVIGIVQELRARAAL